MAGKDPGEQNRECTAATAAFSPVAAEHPLPAENTALVGLRFVAVDEVVAIERALSSAERTCQGFEPAKELFKPFPIRYKRDMFSFLHRRKIVDLDDLSNDANEAIRAGRWEEAERLCARLREEFPEDIDADDRLAQLYQARKDYVKALAFTQAALDKARSDPEKYPPDLVADLVEQADFLRKKANP